MRPALLFLLLLLPFSAFSFSDPRLNMLLDSGEYFRFRIEYMNMLIADSSSRPQEDYLYYSAWEQHLFESPDSSNACISKLVNGKFNCSDSIKSILLQLQLQNDFRSFHYRNADSICDLLLFRYPSVMDPKSIADVKNFGGIAKGLRDVPPQTVERSADLDIAYKRDIASLIRVPVSVNGEKQNFIFDTGANLSTICESEAKRMKLKMTDVSFGVASSSKASVDSKLGIAETLVIGNVVFHNVVFIVMPDKQLKFAGGLYKIKGIVGIPVIAQLGEVQIFKNGRLKSPLQQSESPLFNLGMSGNTPFADIAFYGTSHTYIFDTGAATTVLNARFLSTYHDSLHDVKERTSKVGGAGGVETIKVMNCSQLPYSFGGKTAQLKRGMIQLSASSSVYDSFFGIAGEDIYTQWEMMTINFNRHFVRFD